MSHPINDQWYEDRNQWLEQEGRQWGDVMIDEKGEFIIRGDGMNGEPEKVYLPDNLQQQ